jgi:hypothetical protein
MAGLAAISNAIAPNRFLASVFAPLSISNLTIKGNPHFEA